MRKESEIKTQLVGDQDGGGELEGKILNRIVRWTPVGFELEGDPRHSELVLEQLGLVGCKSVSTPGTDQLDDIDPTKVEEELAPEKVTAYRGIAARLNYLSADRPDILYPVKEACREMASPTPRSWDKLRRIGKYLAGRPRLVWVFKLQDAQHTANVSVDANWAGCKRSRKSISGGAMLIGSHGIKVWSKTQAVVARSSAESELYGAVRGASEALGLQALASDFGDDLNMRLHMDATAAMGIIQRKGLSKVRHIDVHVLWLQEQQCKRLLPIAKVDGQYNCADLLTKNLTFDKLLQYVTSLGMEFRSGRTMAAAQLHSMVGKEDSNGDTWDARNLDGKWVRRHSTWRSRLFTPFKVGKGPGKDIVFTPWRVTRGIDYKGNKLEFVDEWGTDGNRHRDLGILWRGSTTFVEERPGFHGGVRRQAADVERGGPLDSESRHVGVGGLGKVESPGHEGGGLGPNLDVESLGR